MGEGETQSVAGGKNWHNWCGGKNEDTNGFWYKGAYVVHTIIVWRHCKVNTDWRCQKRHYSLHLGSVLESVLIMGYVLGSMG